METLKINRKYTWKNYEGVDTFVITSSDEEYTHFRIVSGNKTGFSEYENEKTIIKRTTRAVVRVFKLVKD